MSIKQTVQIAIFSYPIWLVVNFNSILGGNSFVISMVPSWKVKRIFKEQHPGRKEQKTFKIEINVTLTSICFTVNKIH